MYISGSVCSGDRESQPPDLLVQILAELLKDDNDVDAAADDREEEDGEDHHSTLEWNEYKFASRLSLV